ncbi:MAG: hypothetical protein ACOVNR_09330 [Chitinophagaceae bacterium]
MRLGNKIPLLLQLYHFDVQMPEQGFVVLTLIDKTTGKLTPFEAKTWGKCVDLAFAFMNRELKKNMAQTINNY